MLLALPLLLGAAPRGDDDRPSILDEIRASGILVAGVSRNTPPFSQSDSNGLPVGFDVDLMAGLGRFLGVKVRYVRLAGAARITAVQTGRVQITAATLTPTAGRLRLVDFSNDYLRDAQRILVPRESEIRGAESLAGLRVGVARGSTTETILRQVSPAAIQVTFGTSREALPALITGRIDAIASDTSILEGLRRVLGNPDRLRIAGAPLSRETYAMALPKGDQRWRDLVNDYLQQVKSDGRWEEMAKLWFGEEGARPFPAGFRPDSESGR
jgi:polar amino acid transport system substrate-binding protein